MDKNTEINPNRKLVKTSDGSAPFLIKNIYDDNSVEFIYNTHSGLTENDIINISNRMLATAIDFSIGRPYGATGLNDK